MSLKANVFGGIRARFHPLWRLRQTRLYPVLAKILDIRVGVKLPPARYRIQVRLLRHLSWVLGSETLNPELGALLSAIQEITRPKVFWDVGANIGFYSWLLLGKDAELQAVLFEPDPDNAGLIAKTIQRNKLTRARLETKALSDRSGTEEFVVDPRSSATGHLQGGAEQPQQVFFQEKYRLSETVSVETITGDAAVAKNVPPPDLVKIDTEGAEFRVFQGAWKTVEQFQPVIIFESFSETRDAILKRLESLGYSFHDADDPQGNSSTGYNILCIPKRFDSQWSAILAAWENRLGPKPA
jgi:FkbM family methyltransferase